MRQVFADTFYWIAFVDPGDTWHERVRQIFRALQPCKLITTDEVLVELLAFYSKSGTQLRQRASNLTRDILEGSDIEVIEQSHRSFLEGLALYENRLDKGYSLTDCISMSTMRQLGITEVLTHDKHFTQEGFAVLFPD
ncbi:MAG: PIN domain-containing protein [Plectolyngbya sp. WJT66-NPBG17]|jgi:predicted nucleic acid-binding protein|nr:PIN domain-containing protein [Plectolyngbya sp. WJT66-NPBG17]MBW4528453.1 PIN domain-containing protein [Phormidium tanganyikae FI6-MK23]